MRRKKTIPLFLLSMVSIGLAMSSQAQNLTFTEVVQADSVSQSVLHTRANEWFVYAFNSAKNVIELDEKDGKIIGKGNFMFRGKPFSSGTNSTGPVSFVITIETKDGRYKYTITDFHHDDFGYVPQEEPKGMMKVAMKDVWKDTHKKMKSLIQGLKDYMQTADKKTANNNW